MPNTTSSVIRSTLAGGALVAVLDGLDAIIAYKAVLGLDPVTIYQFVGSGLLGPSAYEGGIATALLGVLVHCTVALGAAGVYSLASTRLWFLVERPVVAGIAYGIGVFAVMSYIVTPMSKIGPSPFSLPLFVNGVVGHALLVGLPVALVARRYVTARSPEPRRVPALA